MYKIGTFVFPVFLMYKIGTFVFNVLDEWSKCLTVVKVV